MKKILIAFFILASIAAGAQSTPLTVKIRATPVTGTVVIDTTSRPSGLTTLGRTQKGLDSLNASIRAAVVPVTRTLTINGLTQSLEGDRTWTIPATAGVSTFAGESGNVTPKAGHYNSFYAPISHTHSEADVFFDGPVDMGGQILYNYNASVNAVTGTSYTVQPSDRGKVITFNNATGTTVTIPGGLGVGFNCTIIQIGTGQVTFTASGTTVQNRQGHTKTAGRFAAVSIIAYITNTLTLSGDTSN